MAILPSKVTSLVTYPIISELKPQPLSTFDFRIKSGYPPSHTPHHRRRRPCSARQRLLARTSTPADEHRPLTLVAREPGLAHAGAVVDDRHLDSVADRESELTTYLAFKKRLGKDNGFWLRGYFR
jgi:hypothetical protein